MKNKHIPYFPRADVAALRKFDPSTKTCTMNCGRSIQDPRTDIERKFLCDCCAVRVAKDCRKALGN